MLEQALEELVVMHGGQEEDMGAEFTETYGF